MKKGPKLLIVEDDKDLLEVLEEHFTKAGFEVVTSSDGDKAMEIINSNPPEVLLADVMIPGYDGWDLTKMVRHSPYDSIKQMPVILMSSRNTMVDIAHGLKLGATAYICKPLEVEGIVFKVQQVLENLTSQYSHHTIGHEHFSL